MISLCVPTIRFSDKEKTVPTAKPVAALKETVTLTPVPENDAMSITYEDAEEKGYKSVEGIYLNNQTSKQIDVSSLLNKSIDLSLSDEPTVLIVHTHTTESYTPSQKYNYTPSETDRTQDSNYNMVAVGKVIYDHLKDNGINVIHDTTVNDYPSYSQSYSKSLKLVESYTKKYPSIKFVIDVHRDAIVTKDGSKMRPVTNFDSTAAQVMLVVGTNDSGLTHPDWQTNLSFAVKLQYKMNSLYPTLARPINLRRERFNQHTAPFAFILEVGTNGNTLDEAKKGALLFSESLVSLLKN
ncbi:MAG: stage II sporulation protein P [Clostridia bacterium]|nr:stage II sporulation protein P [Clostridia bacterium]